VKRVPHRPKVLIAEIVASPETVDSVRELLCAYGETVRREPGNRVFACHQVEGQPARFIVYEVYESEEAFEAHLAAPENAELNRKLAPLVEGGGSVLTFLVPVE
jgi:quinol monooxygenase YgiN